MLRRARSFYVPYSKIIYNVNEEKDDIKKGINEVAHRIDDLEDQIRKLNDAQDRLQTKLRAIKAYEKKREEDRNTVVEIITFGPEINI